MVGCWLQDILTGEHPGLFGLALDHLDLQQNATHRTNFFEGVVDGVTIPGKKMSPCWAQLFFFHMKEDRNKEICETS